MKEAYNAIYCLEMFGFIHEEEAHHMYDDIVAARGKDKKVNKTEFWKMMGSPWAPPKVRGITCEGKEVNTQRSINYAIGVADVAAPMPERSNTCIGSPHHTWLLD